MRCFYHTACDMTDNTISAEFINREIERDAKGFILKCEESYITQVKKATDQVCKKSGKQIIMLAGPSSSGKTTTAQIIKNEALSNSRHAQTISLDDFYLNQNKMLYFEDGTPDFETIKALDVDYIVSCLTSLINEGECLLPRFNFFTKRREETLERIKVPDDCVIIVEGLHALNPAITEHLKNEALTKLYVSVSSRISSNGLPLFSKRDIRFIRRMIRDYHHRNAQVEYTFKLWKGVRKGEDRYLFPFSTLADVRINSLHFYEPCIFKDEARKLLSEVEKTSEFYKSSKALCEKLSLFESVERDLLPKESLLNEFCV